MCVSLNWLRLHRRLVESDQGGVRRPCKARKGEAAARPRERRGPLPSQALFQNEAHPGPPRWGGLVPSGNRLRGFACALRRREQSALTFSRGRGGAEEGRARHPPPPGRLMGPPPASASRHSASPRPRHPPPTSAAPAPAPDQPPATPLPVGTAPRASCGTGSRVKLAPGLRRRGRQ